MHVVYNTEECQLSKLQSSEHVSKLNMIMYESHIVLSITFSYIIDNKYYVSWIGNLYTVLYLTHRVTSSTVTPCVLNVNELSFAVVS